MLAYCGCIVSRPLFTVPSAGCRAADKPQVQIPLKNRTLGVEYQDSRYGKGVRVHNPVRKKTKTERQRGRCSVCGVVRDVEN